MDLHLPIHDVVPLYMPIRKDGPTQSATHVDAVGSAIEPLQPRARRKKKKTPAGTEMNYTPALAGGGGLDVVKYDSSQPRGKDGRWTKGGESVDDTPPDPASPPHPGTLVNPLLEHGVIFRRNGESIDRFLPYMQHQIDTFYADPLNEVVVFDTRKMQTDESLVEKYKEFRENIDHQIHDAFPNPEFRLKAMKLGSRDNMDFVIFSLHDGEVTGAVNVSLPHGNRPASGGWIGTNGTVKGTGTVLMSQETALIDKRMSGGYRNKGGPRVPISSEAVLSSKVFHAKMGRRVYGGGVTNGVIGRTVSNDHSEYGWDDLSKISEMVASHEPTYV